MRFEIATSDFDELAETQQHWDLHYRPLSGGAFHAHLQVRQLDGVQVDMESWGRPVEVTGAAPQEALTVVFPIDAGNDYLSRGREVSDASIDCYLSRTEIHAVTHRPTRLGSLAVNWNELIQGGEALAGRDTALLRTGHLVVKPEPAALRALHDCFRALVRMSDIEMLSGLQTSADRWAASETIDCILQALLPEACALVRPRRRYALARAAQEFMLDRLHTPPTLAEVCAGLGVSQRALHYAFRDVFGISPKAYLKAQRLFAARRALRRAAPDTTVTRVMVELGFFDAGHFARDYRAMCGERPLETLHSARSVSENKHY